MKAWTFDRYGSPDVLRLEDVPDPAPGPGEVLVDIRAAALNPYDWRILGSDPLVARVSLGLRRPRAGAILGADLTGEVVALGDGVTDLAVGDRVLGEVELGACAQRAVASADRLVVVPDGVTDIQAAAVPMAGQTAWKAVHAVGRVGAGDRVLVNGASGGVGTFAVQLAVAAGATVTGVCSGRNAELVRSLGAAAVVDYTATDFTEERTEYDVLIDTKGTHPLRRFLRTLVPDGRLVLVGGGGGKLLGPATQVLLGVLANHLQRRTIGVVGWKPNAADLAAVIGLVADGTVSPVIDRVVPLADVPDALRYLRLGHARGKVVIEV